MTEEAAWEEMWQKAMQNRPQTKTEQPLPCQTPGCLLPALRFWDAAIERFRQKNGYCANCERRRAVIN